MFNTYLLAPARWMQSYFPQADACGVIHEFKNTVFPLCNFEMSENELIGHDAANDTMLPSLAQK